LNTAYDNHDPIAIASAQARIQDLVTQLLSVNSVSPTPTPAPGHT
jgi:hypothetical protein